MNEQSSRALVFVYNAESGLFNALSDAAHKLLSPETYQCQLCALTHSAFRMRGDWKRFLATLALPLEFLHADELRSRYGATGVPLPAIFRREGASLAPLVNAEEINRCRTLEELERLVAERAGV